MVFEATYLVAVMTAGQMSLCCGQNGAQMSKVFRPSNKSNGRFICFFTAAEETVSPRGPVHPPYAKPPLVSSSGPPGPCMTPSREMNSSTLIFLMTEFLSNPICLCRSSQNRGYCSSPQSGLNEPATEPCAGSFISSPRRVFRGRSGQVVYLLSLGSCSGAG